MVAGRRARPAHGRAARVTPEGERHRVRVAVLGHHFAGGVLIGFLVDLHLSEVLGEAEDGGVGWEGFGAHVADVRPLPAMDAVELLALVQIRPGALQTEVVLAGQEFGALVGVVEFLFAVAAQHQLLEFGDYGFHFWGRKEGLKVVLSVRLGEMERNRVYLAPIRSEFVNNGNWIHIAFTV